MVNMISVQEKKLKHSTSIYLSGEWWTYLIPLSTLNDCREISDQIHFGMKYWCFDSVRKQTMIKRGEILNKLTGAV